MSLSESIGASPAPAGPTTAAKGEPAAANADAANPTTPPSTMKDDQHIRYLLSVGARAVIHGLYETKDARGFGGTLWMSKFHPLYKLGSGTDPSGDIRPLQPESHFCKRWFAFADTGESGWVVYFKPTTTRTEVCGWVPPEREAEAEGWIATLNAEIQARLVAAGIQPHATTADARTTATIQRLRALGLVVPDASNMDDLVTQLEQWAQADGPIDARSKDPKPST